MIESAEARCDDVCGSMRRRPQDLKLVSHCRLGRPMNGELCMS